MSEHGFMLDLGIALVAALVGGLLARRLRLPVLLGYLAAGVAVGPHTPGVIAGPEAVRHVAELGVALLMFAVGVHFSLKSLLAVWRTALFAGGIQIAGVGLLGVALGLLLGWGLYGGLFLGCAIALSSTAVMMKVLDERGELDATHGKLMLGILVVQDFSLVLMVILLPALALLLRGEAGAWPALGLAVLRALLFVGATVLLAIRVVPALMDRVAKTGSRELFLLAVLCLCLLSALAASYAGLGVELGAFIAGLMISETEHADEVLAQVRPLRDAFAALFFVSVGMLLEPAFVLHHALAVGLVVVAIAVGKSIISVGAVYALGWRGRTPLLVGLGLAQIGEFSFVLATIGSSRGLISASLASVILASALLSLFLAPFLYQAANPLYDVLAKTAERRLRRERRAGVR